MKIKIRTASTKDIPDIDQVYVEGVIDEIKTQFPKRSKESIIKEMNKARKERIFGFKKDIKSKDNYWVVAEINNKIIGFANAEIKKNEGMLRMLYIDKIFRKKGIGKKLTKIRIKWLRRKKVKSISAGILIKNKASINNLKNFGFKPISIKMELKQK
ncbi:MAG: GNAT family N-acetyltransferase [Nanoarchaeota archaeon]